MAQKMRRGTTLAEECYYAMFEATSLSTPPKLPARTLPTNCYTHMFYDCTWLTVNEESEGSGSVAWKIPGNGTCTNTITMTDMFKYCGGYHTSSDGNFTSGRQNTYYTTNTPV